MPEFRVTCEELRSRANDVERNAAVYGSQSVLEARRLDDEAERSQDEDEAQELREAAQEAREQAGRDAEEAQLEAAVLREQAANRECL